MVERIHHHIAVDIEESGSVYAGNVSPHGFRVWVRGNYRIYRYAIASKRFVVHLAVKAPVYLQIDVKALQRQFEAVNWKDGAVLASYALLHFEQAFANHKVRKGGE